MEQPNITHYATRFTKMTPAFTAARLDDFVHVYESSFEHRSSPKQEHILKTVGESDKRQGVYIEKDNTIAGYIMGSKAADGQSVYIEQVCIAPDFQKQGLGTDLVNIFVQAVRSQNDIHHFSLRTDEIKAHNMYAKTDLGPVVKEISEDFYCYHVA